FIENILLSIVVRLPNEHHRISFNLFFFSSRRRHTRSKRDWSSHVCSSDLLCSAPVMAAEQGGFSGPSATQSQAGGFQGPNGSVTTVESAKSLRDDTWVTLRGNIVERISDDLYVFKDASGTINVDKIARAHV